LALRPDSYPSRRLQGAYLEWAYQRLSAAVPRSVTVTTVADRVTGLVNLADGRQGVRLANGPALAADAVVFVHGQLDERAAAAVEAFLPGTGPSRQAGELAAAALGAVRSRSGSRVPGVPVLDRGGSGSSDSRAAA
jgi:uncharacterized NAD(P)/FAD-binding protein YdhS